MTKWMVNAVFSLVLLLIPRMSAADSTTKDQIEAFKKEMTRAGRGFQVYFPSRCNG